MRRLYVPMKNSASAAMMTATTTISTKPSLDCAARLPEGSRQRGFAYRPSASSGVLERGQRLLEPALTFHAIGEPRVRRRARPEDAPERRAHRGDVADDPDAFEGGHRGPARGPLAGAAHHQRPIERVGEELHKPGELQPPPARGAPPPWPRPR